MQNLYSHIFITFLNRNHDKYFGIKKNLSESSNHVLSDINLSQESINIFLRVEYSFRKYFREIYYSKIFKEIEKNFLNQIIQSKNSIIIVYLQDEGVWSEFLRYLVKKHKIKNVTFVNVQHGFLMFNRNSIFKTRIIQLINNFYTFIFGFPKFGIGPFKGIFDYYLLFHDELVKEVPKNSKVIVCPNLINRDFINKFERKTVNIKTNNNSALFALQHNIPFGTFSKSFEESLKSLLPLIDVLKNHFNIEVYLRKHPGMKKNTFLDAIEKNKMNEMVHLDDDDLEVSLKKHKYIFSFLSTTLFEAQLLGNTSIVINDHSFNFENLPIKYNSVDMKKNLIPQLECILNLRHNSSSLDNEINWKKFIETNL